MATRNSEDGRPMNVEQIVQKAQSFDYNPHIPLKYWLRTAVTLLKEAEIYDHEGNDQQTYLLLFRHAQLVIRNLPNHPDARSPEGKSALAVAGKEVEHSLQKLETLKPRINAKYDRFEKLLKDREARKTTEPSPKPEVALEPDGTHQIRLASDPAVAGNAALAAAENRDLAVRLAHKEIKRRALARKATRQAGISEEVEQERRTAGLWGHWEEALANDDQDKVTLSRQMQNVRLRVDMNDNGPPARLPTREGTNSPFSYPSISHGKAWSPPLPPPLPQISSRDHPRKPTRAPPPPPNPPKDPLSHLPARPAKVGLAQPVTASLQQAASDLKPSGHTFKPAAYLENGSPLRTIFLSPDLRHRFLAIAEKNTRANLETCGILCGTLISNALFISRLVIPEQESTSDTCDTVNEGALFDYVDGEDLMVLGWIHTHPTQTCFMSSRDLHTHSGYQVMMPESIAIVCAPSKGDWGVFRLTDPPGMPSVLNCTQTGLFHPHAESNLYTEALRPGHVFEAKGLEFEIMDLRPN